MGQAAVFDFDQGPCAGIATPAGEAAKKQTIPGFEAVQVRTGLTKGSGIKAAEKDIVLKDQYMLCSGLQPLFQAKHVGFKNAFYPVFRMLCDNDKLYPFQQTHPRELLFRLLPPVDTGIK